MFRAQRSVELGLETPVEVPAIEQPGDRIGLRQPVHRLTLLTLEEARASLRPGLFRIEREEDDDDTLVESWV